jgi:protein tyrosine phosphatase (PTP) superfamily phosphohydrolase (DUF442 family)
MLGLATAAFAMPVYRLASENLHAAVPSKLFRSGQLSGERLSQCIGSYGLRTVVNLRGPNPEDSWYRHERAAAARAGVRHFDLPVDSTYPPTRRELRDWVELFESCEQPVLVHCQSGIDRTGLVTAVGLLLYDPDATLADARRQLSLSYGHLPWRANRGRFLEFLDMYEGWLRETRCQHDAQSFRVWALEVYRPDPEWEYRPTAP